MSGQQATHGGAVGQAEIERQANLFFNAIEDALHATGKDLRRPQLPAVLAALSQTTGQLLASIPEEAIKADMLLQCVARIDQFARCESPHRSKRTGPGVQ